MRGTQKQNFELLLIDLRKIIEATANQHKFWEIRIHGGKGLARVEVHYQGDSYNYQGDGEVIKRSD